MAYIRKNKRNRKNKTFRLRVQISENSKKKISKNRNRNQIQKNRQNISLLSYQEKFHEDFNVLLGRYQYKKQFTAELKNQAAELLQNYQKKIKDYSRQRLDLQNQTIITIDGTQSKDFDDAVSVQELKNSYQIGVHIADVSYFIPAESDLDLAARQRATSVYLLDKVLPMFPEVISNQLCSLVEGKPRLTFSCLLEIDHLGKVKNFKFVKSIIKSKRRCTYGEIQAVLDKKKSLGKEIDQQIQIMKKIKDILHQKRLREGSIEFETQEQEITLEQEKIVKIYRKQRLFSEMIIEELMLITNQCAAQLMNKSQLGIYRVHEAPEPRKLSFFEKTVSSNGVTNFDSLSNVFTFSKKQNKPYLFSTNPLKDQKPNKYQVFLTTLKEKKIKKLFSFLLLTSMKKAEYSNHCTGHYGLAFKKYSHFTSPIRRYPDLLAHRIISDIIDNKPPRINKKEIDKIAKWSSLQERKAVSSEREYKKVKIIRYLQKHLPYRFKGLIVKVLSRGMYVEEEKTGIEGFLSSYLLLQSGFFYDRRQEIFIDNHSFRHYQLGEEINVEIYKLSLENLYIDLSLVE